QQSGLVQRPSFIVNCNPVTIYDTPAMGNVGLPVIGTTYNPSVSDALGSTFAILASGYTQPLATPLPGAPTCNLLTSTETLSLVITSPAGVAQAPITLPNSSVLAGFNIHHQWAIWDPTVNSFGIVMSNGA